MKGRGCPALSRYWVLGTAAIYWKSMERLQFGLLLKTGRIVTVGARKVVSPEKKPEPLGKMS